MTNMYGVPKWQVQSQLDHRANDVDTGEDYSLFESFSGMPGDPSTAHLYPPAGNVPQTFEDSNPEISYTKREREEEHPSMLARNWRVMSYPLRVGQEPIQVLDTRQARVGVQLQNTGTGSGIVLVANEPGAITPGALTGTPQILNAIQLYVNGGPQAINSYGAVFVAAYSADAVVTVIEYLDD